MNDSIAGTLDAVIGLVAAYGLNVVAAIVTLIVGWIAAGWCSRMIRRVLSRTDKIDAMLAGFFASFVRYGILAFTVIAVLSRFGVQTAASSRCWAHWAWQSAWRCRARSATWRRV